MVARKFSGRALSLCLFLLLGAGGITAHAATFVVTTTNDSGAGSFRQAILDANANAGSDSITFNIGSGLKSIAPTSKLPDITDPVIIDGSTQPGFAGAPLIEIDATNIPTLFVNPVLLITAGNTTIRSLIINHFKNGGIRITGAGGNHVEGCYIGPDATGSVTTDSRGTGISVESPNNVIGGTTASARNVIAGLDSYGIGVGAVSSNGNQIQGNYVGLNAAGTARLDTWGGIGVSSSNNTVGGTTPGARNVVGGGTDAGIAVTQAGAFACSGNVVQGNYVGTDVTGTVKFGFTRYGILIANSANDNLIGGTSAGAGNLVSGNGWGIAILGFGSGSGGPPTGNVIQGNLVGVAVDGTSPMPNGVQGIHLDTAFNTIVGGTAAGAGNTVAFNGPSQQVRRRCWPGDAWRKW